LKKVTFIIKRQNFSGLYMTSAADRGDFGYRLAYLAELPLAGSTKLVRCLCLSLLLATSDHTTLPHPILPNPNRIYM
jgi:hypothetical protein